MNIENILENNLTNNNDLNIGKGQNNFLENALGKTINFGLDLGLRALLPSYLEDAVIDIKNVLLKEGFSEGTQQIIKSAIDIGKGAIGIFSGNFENINQVQTAIRKGGIIDGVSGLTDDILNKTVKTGKLNENVADIIRNGKNVILDNIESKIEEEFNNQLNALEKIQKYNNNWREYFNNHDFSGMEKEYKKITEKLKILMPMEKVLKEAKTIQNLHTLVKNNGQDFNLTEEQLKLAEILN